MQVKILFKQKMPRENPKASFRFFESFILRNENDDFQKRDLMIFFRNKPGGRIFPLAFR